MNMKKITALFGFLLLAGAFSARADTVAYTDPAGQGTQAWGGNLGLNFNVLSPITVTELGVFNASGSGTITGTIEVAIFNTADPTVPVTMVTFSGTYTPSGFDVFQAITPIVLGPGSYEVDAVGFNASDLNGNLNTGSSSGPILNNGGGALAFTGGTYDSSASLDDPASCTGCILPANGSQFDAGTFGYQTGTVTSTPEPSSLLLFAAGLIGLLGAAKLKLMA